LGAPTGAIGTVTRITGTVTEAIIIGPMTKAIGAMTKVSTFRPILGDT
jgi:hypothetical protein